MGSRQDSRARIERQIVEVGRRHLVTDGAAGLSLRAIARDLGMVSSAVYRYVASRDELLTLLLIELYTELADAVDRAHRAAPPDWREQLSAVAHTARTWALGQPACWALLYGSPVPGYHAPADRTVTPGTRVIGTLFGIVDAAVTGGAIASSKVPAPEPLSSDFRRLAVEFGVGLDDATLARCFLLWASLVGAISLEVFGQYGADTLTDPALVFDAQVRLLTEMLAG
ncbi:TetR/AcrR family transcriptional regulator [Mycolicibacterium sp. 018/SC-01/001]|uniref:TetR/AcrR family transcriptional regulator n=1 Tax=Mycolicibacterium sp. 018/SC-01/001 TaxID=2592069 RepID=UPI00117E3F01|nr:TetR/AcrR family transcriptional regulator [Mycolicibacterium sp. 018/SC-01/001]TRW82341.1 TetR/AcrR family transcriptional regulator [Mycolicibacterium sp. 018/SC-01/001]